MKATCRDCEFWLPSDPSRDGGRKVIGTCLAIKSYDDALERARNASPNRWNDEEVYSLLAKQALKDKAYIQADDGGGVAFRCPAEFSCALFSPLKKPATKPAA